MHATGDHETMLEQMPESEEEEIVALRQDVQEILEGKAFRGSDRCRRFLAYIVDQTIAGCAEALKERVIGVEIFGLSPSYDTKDHAIVRVTASDVRKRLLQHYGSGAISKFHISLPVGSYIPEITRASKDRHGKLDFLKQRPASLAAVQALRTAEHESALDAAANLELPDAVAARPATRTVSSIWRLLAVVFSSITLLLIALSVTLWGVMRKNSSHAKQAPSAVLPWSVLFNSPHATHLITSDFEIVRIQNIIGRRISLSDYANHNYLPDHKALSPSEKDELPHLMRGNLTPTHDAQIAASVAELAEASGSRLIDVEGARDLEFANLKTDDNFVFLGDQFCDPWFTLFNNQLDFQFVPPGDDTDLRMEVILNAHPRAHEQTVYTSTARGGATGKQYAIAAFISNPGQNGQVLLLAGVSGESTTAAAKLVTDLPRLSAALEKCGIPSSGPIQHFEFLLSVNTMAGLPNQFDIVSCHVLK
jgi:hypothetical protein